jgi:CBS-domain-containing membrane protein
LLFADRMTAGVVTVEEQAGLQELVNLVENHRADAVAVVDGFGRMLGVINVDEHPHLFCVPAGPRVAGTPGLRRRQARRALAATTALMSPAATVRDAWPVGQALHSLAAEGADVAFVVDDLGCVLGTITHRQCRPAPAARTAPKEAGHDQVRV